MMQKIGYKQTFYEEIPTFSICISKFVCHFKMKIFRHWTSNIPNCSHKSKNQMKQNHKFVFFAKMIFLFLGNGKYFHRSKLFWASMKCIRFDSFFSVHIMKPSVCIIFVCWRCIWKRYCIKCIKTKPLNHFEMNENEYISTNTEQPSKIIHQYFSI